jgi:phosphoglycerol transferase
MKSNKHKNQFSFKYEAVRALVLLVGVLILWVFIYNKITLESWQLPPQYGSAPNTGDTKFSLTMIKTAMDGHLVPFLSKVQPNLGAPMQAQWDDIPMPEQLLFWGVGRLANWIGLFTAANFAVLLAYILAGVSFYLVARVLALDWRYSLVSGVLFAFTAMAHARMLHHLVITYYWHIPLALLICYWILEGNLKVGSRRFWVSIAIGLITGIQNPYFTAMILQLVCLCALKPFFERNWGVVLSVLAFIFVTLGAFFCLLIPNLVLSFSHGSNDLAFFRAYRWVEMFALKPLDLFMPPPWHPVEGLARIGDQYRAGVLVPSELPPSNYLGIIGISALGLLIYDTIKKLSSRPPQQPPVEILGVFYIVAFSIIGGLNGILGVMGFYMLRSSNRFSIFILAIVLLYAVKRLSELSFFKRNGLWIAPVLALIGLYDQLPAKAFLNDSAAIQKEVRADAVFVQKLEASLPAGAMVFQVPFCPFPEANYANIPDYEHLRPFLYSKNLRYSFGHVKGRGYEAWQTALLQKPLNDIIWELDKKGFQAIIVYRPAFGENAEKIVQELQNVTKGQRIDHDLGILSAVVLNSTPSAR